MSICCSVVVVLKHTERRSCGEAYAVEDEDDDY